MLTSDQDPSHGSAAGIRAGARNGSLLMSDPDELGHSAKDFLSRRGESIVDLILMGGTDVLGAGVEADIDYTEPVSGSIVGSVTTQEGPTALAGVRVAAYGWDRDSTDYPVYRAHQATTGPDGSYEIGHLEPGMYWLTFTDTVGTRAAESYPTAPGTGGHGDLVSVEASPAPPTRVDEQLMTSAAWAAQRVTRLSGSDRYATALAVSKASHRAADTAVIVSGEGFADALSASAIAGAYRAPLFLTRPGALPVGLIAELDRLGVERLVIVGGTGAVSAEVEDDLADEGFTIAARIAGADRFATSAEAYRHLRETSGLPTVAPAPFVARGDTFPDALSAAPFAFRQVRPILLVRPDSVPASITALFSAYGIDSAYVAGGTGAVSDQVLSELATAAGVADLDSVRIQGVDRYATSAAMASHWGRPYDFLGVASGATYPDALVGGVLAGARGGAVLLTHPTALDAPAAGVLADNAERLRQVRLFGGTGALTPGVQSAVTAAATP